MNQPYVEKRNDAYWVTGTRISLDSIVYHFKAGASPESIVQAFPLLTLEQVYGAITYYLAHTADVDAYLAEGERQYEAFREAQGRVDPQLRERMERVRQQLLARHE